MRVFRVCTILLALAITAAAAGHPAKPSVSAPVTWSANIAPLVDHSCAECHFPGGPAPFSLLEYTQVRSHARQIAQVTVSRFMPPWLPAANSLPLKHSRRLTLAQIRLFQKWAAQGAPEGNPALAPKSPQPQKRGWRLGPPNLVLRMTRPYRLPPETTGPYRCFVLPLPPSHGVWVRAIQFRPGNPAVVRHATVLVDPDGIAEKLQAQSGTIGYVAVNGGLGPHAQHLAQWAVGSGPFLLPGGSAVKLPAHASLVLILRFEPDGQSEPVQSEVGLYDAAKPPRSVPVSLTLGRRNLMVQADQKGTVTADFLLPVPVRLGRISPHANPICESLQVLAHRAGHPDLNILQINHWNSDWQTSYRPAAPLVLPAGTRIQVKWSLDNSSANPRNPSSPAMTQLPGLDYLDQMATVHFLLLPLRPSDRTTLIRAIQSLPLPLVRLTRPRRQG